MDVKKIFSKITESNFQLDDVRKWHKSNFEESFK